jgi:ubiquinone biosynthesis protein UbiJ
MARKLSKHRLNGKIERLSRGVAIYRTFASPYWLARVWDARAARYVVRSTKETGKLKARQVAQEIAHELTEPHRAAPQEFSFKT